MRRIQYHAYGGPDVMRLEPFEPEAPRRGEVAVAVRCAAINPIDWKLRNGAMKIVTGRSFPRAMGMDLAGYVTAVGPGVVRFAVGDAVFGLARFKQAGALGERVVAREIALAKKPADLSFEDAACLGTAGVTAWNGLVDKAKVTTGQAVFVNGCGGSVGEAAVQIAGLFGASVSGSCGADAMARARSLGVRDVYDYRTTNLANLPSRYDIVFDAAGTMPTALGIGMLRAKGTFATVEPTAQRFLRALVDRRLKPIVATPRADLLDRLANAAQEARFRLPIGEIVPLESAIALLADLERGRKLGGKAVVAVS